jgi:hypothetical protein
MVNYKNGKIYKIVNDVNDKFYIGSTTEPYLSNRMSGHRKKHNDCMSKSLGVDLKECSIILIENYPCKDKNELLRKEREYFDKYKKEGLNIVNKIRPIITKEEKKKLYKDYDYKTYRENNKEKLKLDNKKWYDKVKDTEEFKKKNNERKKKYYEKNKEAILKKQREKYRERKLR